MTLITNIQKYSIHDGRGIRTSVFFKGCPLNCIWCHNPENQSFEKEVKYYESRCIRCGKCVEACKQNIIQIKNNSRIFNPLSCIGCGDCVNTCSSDALALIGEEYTKESLLKEILKDQLFFEQSDGGVTLSGGEVFSMDQNYIDDLIMQLYEEGINIFLDTCVYAPFERIKKVLPFVDTFMVDIKAIDDVLHKKLTGVGNRDILRNIQLLNSAKANLWIRIPLIKGANAEYENVKEIADWLKNNNIMAEQINLLPYHSLGADKYKSLYREYGGDCYEPPTDKELTDFQAMFYSAGYKNVKIGG